MNYLLVYIFAFRGALTMLSVIPAMIMAWEPWGTLQYTIGLLLVLLGIGVRFSGIRRIGRRAHVHTASARYLVFAGIYGHVRNPLYIGNTLFAGGLVSMFFSLSGAAFAIVYLVGLYTLIAMHEEQNLVSLFGRPYERYLSEVPRWRFRLRAYRPSDPEEKPVPVREILAREKYMFATGVVLSLLVGLEWAAFPYLGMMVRSLSHIERPFTGTVTVLLVFLLLCFRIAYKISRKTGSRLKAERAPFRKAVDKTMIEDSES